MSSKPIILLESNTRIPYNEFGELLKTGMYKPHNVSEIENILKEIFVNKKDILKGKRQEIIDNEFFLPEKGSGEYIVRFLKKQLQMD